MNDNLTPIPVEALDEANFTKDFNVAAKEIGGKTIRFRYLAFVDKIKDLINTAKESALDTASRDATSKVTAAKNELRGGVAADKDTLKKVVDFIIETVLANSGVSLDDLLTAIRGEVPADKNTLEKLNNAKAEKNGNTAESFYAKIGFFSADSADAAVRVYGDRILCATNNGGSERPFGLNDQKTIMVYPEGLFYAKIGFFSADSADAAVRVYGDRILCATNNGGSERPFGLNDQKTIMVYPYGTISAKSFKIIP